MIIEKQITDIIDTTISGEIVTYTGQIIKPLDPDPMYINIEDIAHSLSNSCRFTGHVKEFFSVGQHSCHVSDIVPEEDKLWGLLHDASEAYLSDIARPVKVQKEFGSIYREIEQRIMDAVILKFDLELTMPASVKNADDILLRTEQRDLMPPLRRVDGDDYLEDPIVPWSPARAKMEFLKRYYELRGE